MCDDLETLWRQKWVRKHTWTQKWVRKHTWTQKWVRKHTWTQKWVRKHTDDNHQINLNIKMYPMKTDGTSNCTL